MILPTLAIKTSNASELPVCSSQGFALQYDPISGIYSILCWTGHLGTAICGPFFYKQVFLARVLHWNTVPKNSSFGCTTLWIIFLATCFVKTENVRLNLKWHVNGQILWRYRHSLRQYLTSIMLWTPRNVKSQCTVRRVQWKAQQVYNSYIDLQLQYHLRLVRTQSIPSSHARQLSFINRIWNGCLHLFLWKSCHDLRR